MKPRYLTFNHLTTVPSQIGNLTALTLLDLGGNKLTALPPEIGNLTALTLLDLGGNKLTALPPEIGNLTGLTELRLPDNELSSLPPEIGNLTALIALSLHNNELSSLPAGIGNLTALTSLSLRSNELTNLPSEISNLTALTSLDLVNNELARLPPEIGNLTALTSLDLVNNELTSLPSEISNLTALIFFHLDDNALTSLPAEIGNLTALEFLDLQNNALIGLPGRIGNLSRLKMLDLGNNNMTNLPSEIGNLTALRSLYLQKNHLTALPLEIGGLDALWTLNLEKNDLVTLPPEIGNLSALEKLRLGDNDLVTLPSEIGKLVTLTSFHLHNNPLSGDVPAYLTSLNLLRKFTFYGTEWCVPASGEVPLWLDGIADWYGDSGFYGTGRVCGQAPSGLRGRITLPDADPAANVQVNVYQPISRWGDWHHVTTTHTLADGSYQVNSLGQGIGYRVRFVDPTHTYATEYYDDYTSLAQATPLKLTLEEIRTGVDGVLNSPQPPRATVEIDQGSVTYDLQDGMAMINIMASNPDDITVTRADTCASGTASTVTLTLDPPGTVYSMTQVSGDDYRATIPGADIIRDADLVVAATCGVTTTETTVGRVNLYDPNGTISDARSGEPVADATVTLYRVPGWEPKFSSDDDQPHTCQSNDSKAPGEPWSQPAPTELGVIVNPEVTTVGPSLFYQQTDGEGHYGWNVSEGCWYVTVEAEGYDSLTSPVVGVPPEVTDLNLSLMPEGFDIQVVKSAMPTLTITNGSAITYTLIVSASEDTTLHLYDELDPNLMWQGFVGDVPETLTYTTALTGTVALSATTPLTVTFAAEVDLPAASFINEYAQVSNTAYYQLPIETLMMKHPSNTVTRTIYDKAIFEIFLPLVLRQG